MKSECKNKSASGPSPDDILKSSAKGAYYLVLLQLLSRLLTFALHQVILRYTNPRTFGIAAVQLELLLATILFLSREGFRCALLRDATVRESNDKKSEKAARQDRIYANTSKGVIQKITNLSYVSIPFGVVLSVLACVFYLYFATEEAIEAPYYTTSVILYGLSALGELLIEPLYIAATNNLMFTVRVRCEGVGVVVRCIITLLLTLMGAPADGKGENKYGVLAFAVAQFAYTLVLVFGYIEHFVNHWDMKTLKPRRLVYTINNREYQKWFDDHLLSLATTFTKQSLLKHILTEGDKMLITWLCTAEDQGVYAFVVNYGCLIVRILFQPLEETGRTLFSKLLAGVDRPEENEVDKSKDAAVSDIGESSREQLLTAAKILATTIKLHLLLGLLFIAFGTNYTGAFIDLLVGARWSIESPAPLVLSFYCLYVPVMGVNGITEAFVAAVASEEILGSLNYWLMVFSAGFCLAGVLFVRVLSLGAIGLVAANIFNLSMRILWSWGFIRKYFLKNRSGNVLSELERQLSLKNLIPSPAVVTAFALGWAVTYWSDQEIGWMSLNAKIWHFGLGCVCALIVLGVT
ncbi:6703_t:CDS:2 [Paraglomus brasilianum]|uniref:Man(5)GlcNAc(2)-PP-dolichol translocation protein RFT1 n=1 Tax=Paraglomus brasilianum TaxID=144538 RepID=A0A9N8W1T0_9GLOM|nr:6703_t:CDS:2 [Paraglomus brasilianum]